MKTLRVVILTILIAAFTTLVMWGLMGQPPPVVTTNSPECLAAMAAAQELEQCQKNHALLAQWYGELGEDYAKCKPLAMLKDENKPPITEWAVTYFLPRDGCTDPTLPPMDCQCHRSIEEDGKRWQVSCEWKLEAQ